MEAYFDAVREGATGDGKQSGGFLAYFLGGSSKKD